MKGKYFLICTNKEEGSTKIENAKCSILLRGHLFLHGNISIKGGSVQIIFLLYLFIGKIYSHKNIGYK